MREALEHDDLFPGRPLRTITAAQKDGKNHLVNRGDSYAAAYWTGDMWAFRRSHADQAPVQIDFDPTHFVPERTNA